MTAESRYPHLDKNVAPVADMSSSDRIAYIQRDRFIRHRIAREILDELDSLIARDDQIRPQGRLLASHSLMGKTTLIAEFLSTHPASDNPGGDAAIVPALSIQCPETAKEGVYAEIIKSLNVKPPKSMKTCDLRHCAIDLMRKVGVRIIFIDEFHNILEGSPNAQRKALNSIKYLINALQRPVVVSGTSEAITAISSDIQISSRLEKLIIPRFKNNDDFTDLLYGFELLLPLRRASNLDSNDLPELIHTHSNGILGNIADLLNKAAIIAIKSGTETISRLEIESIKSVKEKSLSIRDLLG